MCTAPCWYPGFRDSFPVGYAAKAKRRMEEERMGKLEKYREDYEVQRFLYSTFVPFKGMQSQRYFQSFDETRMFH